MQQDQQKKERTRKICLLEEIDDYVSPRYLEKISLVVDHW